MKQWSRSRHILAALLIMLSVFFVFASSAQAANGGPHGIVVHPKLVRAELLPGATPTFKCQQPTYRIHCYGPQQIRNAYAIQPLLDKGITGKGRTIVIIDAFQSPTVQADLDMFSNTFGISSTKVNIIAPDGLTPFNAADPNQVGWAEEISLDVQWAHAIAPDATIDLALAKSNNDPDLLSIQKYVVDHNIGDVISQSFGEGEICSAVDLHKQLHPVFAEAAEKHITVFASAGDQGSAQPTCDNTSYYLSASTPADDPLVTGVGGTQLKADLTTGQYISESTWNEVATYGAAGGGGYSTEYKRPFYQIGTVKGKWRGVPDVAYNGAIDGGVLTYLGFLGPNTGFHIFGGTSAGSPQWAAIIALGDQLAGHRLGFINPTLYAIGHTPLYSQAFHDITVGDNTYSFQDASGKTVTIPGYNATKGWDASTGWGTPIAENLLPLLALFDYSGFHHED